MLREFGTLCLAPVVLLGYMTNFEIRNRVSTPTSMSGTVLQVQSCERGLGVDVKVSSVGIYGADLQYGVQWVPEESYTVTLTPRLGISYVDHPVHELPQRAQFGLGGALTLGYKHARIGLEWWHASNGRALGLNVSDKPNIGVDMVAIMGGWSF